MTRKPFVIQTGMGVDVHGGDATTAAVRAIDEAIRHNSLVGLRTMGLTSIDQMKVEVTIACPMPESVNVEAVAKALPVGEVSVSVQEGGMLVPTPMDGDPMLIALASVFVSVEEG